MPRLDGFFLVTATAIYSEIGKASLGLRRLLKDTDRPQNAKRRLSRSYMASSAITEATNDRDDSTYPPVIPAKSDKSLFAATAALWPTPDCGSASPSREDKVSFPSIPIAPRPVPRLLPWSIFPAETRCSPALMLGTLFVLVSHAEQTSGQNPGQEASEKKYEDFDKVVKGAKEYEGLFRLHLRGRSALRRDSVLISSIVPSFCPSPLPRGLGQGRHTLQFRRAVGDHVQARRR